VDARHASSLSLASDTLSPQAADDLDLPAHRPVLRDRFSAQARVDERAAQRPALSPPPSTPAPAGVHERLAARMRALIGADRYAGSFQHKALFRLIDGRVEVAASSRVLAGLLERRFADAVGEAAQAELGVAEVRFVVAPDLFGPEAEKAAQGAASGIGGDGPIARLAPAPATPASQVEVKPVGPTGPVTQPGQLKATPKAVQRFAVPDRYRLESFVVSESNRLAYNAAVQMAEATPDAAQPLTALFIHGPCGVGKTHLASGIAIRFRERHPGATVRVTSAEAFMNDYVAAVRSGDVDRFRRSYRRVDLLCIDDVHFFSGKQSTQGELLHTLDEIARAGARVVLVSDEHPRQVRQFSAALVSRFMAGMVAGVAPPDADLRRRVVRLFASSRGLVLEDAAVELLVERTSPRPGLPAMSVRDIEGLLTRVDAVHRLAPEYARSVGGAVGAGAEQAMRVGVLSVERALAGTASSGPPAGVGPARSGKPVRIDAIIVHTCTALAIDQGDLAGKTRHKRVVAARAIITHLARQFTTLSFPEIARAIGRPNHSTVITALQRLQRQLETDEPVDAPGAPEARTLGALIRQLASSLQALPRA
jgi:chromosomal replication initiator protein